MVDVGLVNDRSPAVAVELGYSKSKQPVQFLYQRLQLIDVFSLLQGEGHEFRDRCAKGTFGVVELDVIDLRFRAEGGAAGILCCSVFSLLGKRIVCIFRVPVYNGNKVPIAAVLDGEATKIIPFTKKTMVGSSVSYPT